MSDPKDPEQKPTSEPTVQLTPEEITQLQDRAGSAGAGPHDPEDELVGTLLRNKWRVLERIGAGSFGTVYKVQDERGGWTEALKILSVERLKGAQAENMRQRFLREARIMKRLGAESPYIVGLSTYEEDIASGLIYFLMEHVEGRVLSEVLAHDGPLDLDRGIRVALQVCDGLIVAHEGPEPVVHRDLKLDNLMLTTDRNGDELVKVLDFGIAKIAEVEGDSRLTTVGTLGTPGYAAPEQLRAGDVDGRTDLFAFGVILYSLLTGRNPWLGHLAHMPTNQTYELMAASDRAAPMPMEEAGVEVSPEMVDVVMRLLRRDPEDRFQSARELRATLLQIQANKASGEGLADGADPAMRGAHRGKVLVDVSTREMEERGRDAPERRLAAVWFADLVGYSSLSSTDEGAALALLETFHDTARRVIPEGGGRLVQFIGDAAFAEFTSTERAVRTAMRFLAAFTEATEEAQSKPQLRVGIHVGDVLIGSDGDLFGDGVNVAARIQNEADPGQILVSQDVWRQLKQRRDFGFLSVGERDLKGIGSPVWLFAVADRDAPGATVPIGTDPSLAAARGGKGRLVRVAGVTAAYLASAAVVYFSSEFLVERLGLAPWVLPAAGVLLVTGFLVMLMTAWFQSRPTWERHVSEQPPWTLDMPDLILSVSRRELPQLTWARAIVGGVAAFGLLFGAAGGFLLVRGINPSAPLPAVAEATLTIVPFTVDAGNELWIEGVPDLLGLALDDVPGLRVIDPRVVQSRWDGASTSEANPGVALARSLGAGFAAEGSVNQTDGGLRVSLRLYDGPSGELVGQANVSGAADSVHVLVEELAIGILEAGALPVPPSQAGALRLSELTSQSPAALRDYLRGEQYLRRSDLPAAIDAFESAVEADADFATALFHLALARSWMPPSRAPSSDPDSERAEQLAGELSERERSLVVGLNLINQASDQAITVLKQATTRYPDDPDGWFLLGDALFHQAGQAGEIDARTAFERAIELAPGFSPAYTHLVDGALASGDTTGARLMVDSFRDVRPEDAFLTSLDEAVAAARAAEVQVAEASPTDSTPTVVDALAPQRAQFQRLAATVGDVRNRVAQSLHPALRDRFEEAEALWEAANASSSNQEYELAVSTLEGARREYETIQRDNDSLQRVETVRADLVRLRSAAQNPALIAQATQTEERANRAVTLGQYEDAISGLTEAADLLERAAQPREPPTEREESGQDDGPAAPSVAPPPTSAEVTDQVLETLKRAIEAEDLGRVRGVWTSISSQESQALEALFSSVRDLSVTYRVTDIEERGTRLIVTVQTNYSFVADQSGQPISSDTGQVFELQRSGSEWVIIASTSQGF